MATLAPDLIERLKHTYLIKVVEKEEWAQAVSNGNLRLGSIRSYREFEKDSERGDQDEGAVIRGLGRHFRIELDGEKLTDVLDVAVHYNRHDDGAFLFCTYSLSLKDAFRCGVYKVPSELGRFGKFIVIVNALNFVGQALKSCREQTVRCNCNFVSYVGDDFSGSWGFFRKRKRYAHQQEFRFMIEAEPHDSADPSYAYLKIGPLPGAVAVPLTNGFFRVTHPCPICREGEFTGIIAPERRRPKRIRAKIRKRFGAFHHFQRCGGCGIELKVVGRGEARTIRPRKMLKSSR